MPLHLRDARSVTGSAPSNCVLFQFILVSARISRILTGWYYILGIAKFIGALVLIQRRFKTIKEWAYAGFTIDILGASSSSYFVEGIGPAIFTTVFLIPLRPLQSQAFGGSGSAWPRGMTRRPHESPSAHGAAVEVQKLLILEDAFPPSGLP
jgi:hypothetical protein